MKGKFIILVGCSGSGKSAIMKAMMQYSQSYHLVRSVTTRAMRKSDRDEEQYIPVTQKEFNEMVDSGTLLEYSRYANGCYGTPIREYEEAVKSGKIAIKAMDIDGAMCIKDELGEDCQVLFIYRDKADATRSVIERAVDGKCSVDDVQRRLNTMDAEYANAFKCDAIIRNVGTINEAAEKIRQFIYSINTREIADNVHEITLVYDRLYQNDASFRDKCEMKREKFDKIGVSFWQSLSSYIYAGATDFLRSFDAETDDYIISIEQFAEEHLRRFLKM